MVSQDSCRLRPEYVPPVGRDLYAAVYRQLLYGYVKAVTSKVGGRQWGDYDPKPQEDKQFLSATTEMQTYRHSSSPL